MTWLRIGRRVFKAIGEHDLSGAAAELAYKAFLALMPFLIFLASLGAFVSGTLGIDNPTDELMSVLGDSLPADAASVLRQQLDTLLESKNPTLLSISILGTVWAASSAMGTVIKALNRVFGVRETRPLWRRYGTAVGLTALAGSVITAAFVIQFAGQLYGVAIAGRLGLGDAVATAFSLARWPAALLILLLAVSFLFWAAPNIRLPWKWITPGATLSVVVWLLGTYLFGLYVANFASYNATYGALGGIVLLLTWLYLSSLVLLVGATLNAVLADEALKKRLAAQARALEGGEAPQHSGPGWVLRGLVGALAVVSAVTRLRSRKAGVA